MTVSAVTSTTVAVPGSVPGRPRSANRVRVRDRVREGLAVIAFSAATSTGIAVCFALLLGVLGS